EIPAAQASVRGLTGVETTTRHAFASPVRRGSTPARRRPPQPGGNAPRRPPRPGPEGPRPFARGQSPARRSSCRGRDLCSPVSFQLAADVMEGDTADDRAAVRTEVRSLRGGQLDDEALPFFAGGRGGGFHGVSASPVSGQ